MKKRVSKIAGIGWALASLALWGCGGKSGPTIPTIAKDTKAFDAASAEMKADWNVVLAAAETNGYAIAILTCKKLQKTADLTDDQRKAVNDTQTAVMARMRDAVEKGDQNAIDDNQEVREHWR